MFLNHLDRVDDELSMQIKDWDARGAKPYPPRRNPVPKSKMNIHPAGWRDNSARRRRDRSKPGGRARKTALIPPDVFSTWGCAAAIPPAGRHASSSPQHPLAEPIRSHPGEEPAGGLSAPNPLPKGGATVVWVQIFPGTSIFFRHRNALMGRTPAASLH